MLRNSALLSLDRHDLAHILPHLSEMSVERGQVLTAQGRPVEHLYFPVTAYLANSIVFQGPQPPLTFVTGSEWVFGLGPFLADEVAAWNVEVRSPGQIYRLPAIALRRRMNVSPTLQAQLLRLAFAYQAQVSFGVVCASRHLATGRLATLILKSADRANSEGIHLTQQDTADFLGMQRTTANASAKALKAAGAIRYGRGTIRIANRDLLLKAACDCYVAARPFVSVPANDIGSETCGLLQPA